jgi:CheY-like chemotaxis protein
LTVYLSSLNYTVVSARDGNEALAICAEHGPELQLLITDVVMPGISGRELGEQLLMRYPGMKVLYLSGYTDEAIIRHGILPSGVFFLQKPFQLSTLSDKVRSILDGTATPYKGPRADLPRAA